MSKVIDIREVNTPDEVSVGDILLRRKLTVMHVGIYIAADTVLHSIPGEGQHTTTLARFAKHKTVYALPSGVPEDQVTQRAQALLDDPKKYQLFQQNCEHTVSEILDGQSTSRQLEEVEAWSLIGAAIGKSFGQRTMYLGGLIGAIAGVISLPRMWWLR